MEKLLISFKRLSWAMVIGGSLLMGASACSKGEEAGAVNVEEGEFKDRDPTENNPEGLSDKTQDQNARALENDSSYEEIYDRQEEKGRQRNTGSGVGGASTTGQ